jgi:hypothetical protein
MVISETRIMSRLKVISELRPGFDRITVRMSTTFTDVRNVRWRLDENSKLHRCQDKTEGIAADNPEVTARNEENPVIVVVLPPSAAGCGAASRPIEPSEGTGIDPDRRTPDPGPPNW